MLYKDGKVIQGKRSFKVCPSHYIIAVNYWQYEAERDMEEIERTQKYLFEVGTL
jgi:hypothetical protein